MQFKEPINLKNYYNPWIKPGVVVAKEKQKPVNNTALLEKIHQERSNG